MKDLLNEEKLSRRIWYTYVLIEFKRQCRTNFYYDRAVDQTDVLSCLQNVLLVLDVFHLLQPDDVVHRQNLFLKFKIIKMTIHDFWFIWHFITHCFVERFQLFLEFNFESYFKRFFFIQWMSFEVNYDAFPIMTTFTFLIQ
jgi:hypothetical protein